MKQAEKMPVKSEAQHPRKALLGIVVSDKMDKTVVVKVERRVKHGLYGKYVTKSIRYKAHDDKESAKTGDLVSIVETRPLSKQKRWALQSVVRRSGQTLEVSV